MHYLGSRYINCKVIAGLFFDFDGGVCFIFLILFLPSSSLALLSRLHKLRSSDYSPARLRGSTARVSTASQQ